MGKILAFQIEDFAAIRAAAAPYHIGVERIEPADYRQTLGDLYRGRRAEGEAFQGDVPRGSLLVFCGVEEKILDKLLAAIRKKRVDVTYKAVLTRTNAAWNVLRVYFEMERERQAYEKAVF